MKKSSFVEGTIIATVAIVFVKILGMLYVIPFYATVGVQGAALYAYAYNIYNIFLDISTAGLPTAISKIISEYNTLGKMDAKVRAYRLGLKILSFISIGAFFILFVFANQIGMLLLGDLSGGNTVSDVAFVIRAVSFALLVVPFLSVSKGYLQGHKVINVSSVSQVIEQVVRITIILGGSFLALKVFHLSLRNAVGIAVFGAFVGGLAALSYVFKKLHANKKELGLDGKDVLKDDISNREILKKIVKYAVPFIIISTAVSIYNFINMVFILRTLNFLNYPASEVEFITSAITTWSPKLNMIVTSIAMGMTISLIPTIVSAFTLKDWNDVSRKFNKAMQIILVMTVPMVVGLSLLARPVWTVFYGANEVGSHILMIGIFTALFQSFFMITNSTLQGLNKFKTVYLSTITGFFINAVLDIPLMLLFHKLGWGAYYGALIATCIGYSISIGIAFVTLKKDHGLNYRRTKRTLIQSSFPLLAMILVLLLCRFIPYEVTSKTSCIFYIGLSTLLGGFTYLFLAYKIGLLNRVFGRDYVHKIIKKLTFGKVS